MHFDDQAFAKKHHLNRREMAFVRQFPKDFNGARAARDAGYAKGSAKEQAYRMLTKDHIRAALTEIIGSAVAETGLNVQEVIEGLRLEARGEKHVDESNQTSSAARVTAWSHLGRIAGAFAQERPNPLAGLDRSELFERVEGMLRQTDRETLLRMRDVIDEALSSCRSSRSSS